MHVLARLQAARAGAVRLVLIAGLAADPGCGEGAPSGDAPWTLDFGADRLASLDAAVDARRTADRSGGGDRVAADTSQGPCGPEMVLIGASACFDRHEAPNVPGALPLVMYTFVDAEAWCQARGKRLCYDDDWTLACATAAGLSYPYGNTHQPGVCNDDKTWKVYDQDKLNGWPATVSSPTVTSFADLLAAARAKGVAATAAADHVESLYQATPAGAKTGCTNSLGALDTQGNVEEWTRRRDGGTTSFHGNLKGRYWAEARTCQSGVTTHGDGFRFYEIGFRCCRDVAP